MTGFFQGTLSLGTVTLASAGGTDAFVARLSAGGAPITGKAFGDAMDQKILFVRPSATTPGQLVVAGVFKGAIDFGKGSLISKSGYDIFVDTLPVPTP